MESLFTFDMPVLEFVNICDVMRNLVPFVQFKKRENSQGGVLLLVKLQLY